MSGDTGRSHLPTTLGITLWFVSALIVSPSPGRAQNVRSFSVSADNDGFVFWVPSYRRPDRYYTSGLKLEALVAWAPRWARILASGEPQVCGTVGGSPPCFLTRVTLGQEIYTPDYLFDPDPSSHDRPYAGWLYLEGETERIGIDRSTRLSVQLGVTGGPSLASTVHRWFHRSLHKHEPVGWDYQIPFEPAFRIRYEARRTFAVRSQAGVGSLNLEPRGAVEIGTVRSGLTAGLFAEAGWNVPSPLMPGGGEPRLPFLVMGFGVEGDMVMRDLFLDGSTWSSSLSADRKVWVARFRGRISVGLGRMGLELGATRSTLEFREQQGPHTYGTIRLIFFS